MEKYFNLKHDSATDWLGLTDTDNVAELTVESPVVGEEPSVAVMPVVPGVRVTA